MQKSVCPGTLGARTALIRYHIFTGPSLGKHAFFLKNVPLQVIYYHLVRGLHKVVIVFTTVGGRPLIPAHPTEVPGYEDSRDLE